MREIVFSSEARRPALRLGTKERLARCGAPLLQDFQRALCGWGVLGCLGAALPQAQEAGTARRSGGATAPLHPAWPGGAVATCDCTGQPLAACTRGACIRCPLGGEWAGPEGTSRRGHQRVYCCTAARSALG